MTMLPPNPADLATEHAAALAQDATSVFEYLADVATAAVYLAEQYAEDADYLAVCAPEGDDRDRAEEYARQARVSAGQAARSARRAEDMVEAAGSYGAIGQAAEDIEPAALAEVAADLAEAVAVALAAVARGGQS